MSKKIYVGNMSYDIDEPQLTDLFAEHGEVVSTKIIVDQFTGRSKGFAFIEMTNDEEALAAIADLNGKEINGRQLKVNEAFDKPRKPQGGGGNRGNFRKSNRF